VRKWLVGLTIVAAAVPMLAGVAQLPRPGNLQAPVHTHVAARYIAEGPAEAGAENLVTAVLLNYRGFDTFGEVMVIFTALAAVMAVMAVAPAGTQGSRAPGTPAGISISPVVAFIIRLTAPFIAAFGAFVIFKGHVTPGGGFQGGVILGALLMLLSIAVASGKDRPLLPEQLARWLQAAGPIAFAAVGAFGLALTGALLGFPAAPELALVRELMMIALELGIGLGGGAIILGLFLAMRGD
jgi:multicomponent Na+:H+ antiporter subunit B